MFCVPLLVILRPTLTAWWFRPVLAVWRCFRCCLWASAYASARSQGQGAGMLFPRRWLCTAHPFLLLASGIGSMRSLSLLHSIARGFSLLGGIALTALTLMTCYSVIGRNFFESPLTGDFELTGIACGMAIASFMPLCQWERGHIIVDFFTAQCSPSVNAALDRLGAGGMAGVYALLSWRSALAAGSAYENQGASMLLGFPDWILLVGMAIPLGQSALIAAVQAVRSSSLHDRSDEGRAAGERG